jgi:hypothetical protein
MNPRTSSYTTYSIAVAIVWAGPASVPADGPLHAAVAATPARTATAGQVRILMRPGCRPTMTVS